MEYCQLHDMAPKGLLLSRESPWGSRGCSGVKRLTQDKAKDKDDDAIFVTTSIVNPLRYGKTMIRHMCLILVYALIHPPKVCGFYSICFLCSPTSIKHVYTTNSLLHWQIKYNTSTYVVLKIKPPLIQSRLSKCTYVVSLNHYITPPNCAHY